MKILHGIQGKVEIVHGTIHLIGGAIGIGEVKSPLEESRLAFESSQTPVNGLGQGVGKYTLQQPPQSLGKGSLSGGLIDMPELVKELLAERGFRAIPIADFNHLMEKAQNPDDARE